MAHVGGFDSLQIYVQGKVHVYSPGKANRRVSAGWLVKTDDYGADVFIVPVLTYYYSILISCTEDTTIAPETIS